jgi:hypothetical protein
MATRQTSHTIHRGPAVTRQGWAERIIKQLEDDTELDRHRWTEHEKQVRFEAFADMRRATKQGRTRTGTGGKG